MQRPLWNITLLLFTLLLLGVFNNAQAQGPILNPANGHYYELVTGYRSWTTARAEAEQRTFQGQAGHLATITITGGDGQTALGTTNIAWLAPSLFSANSNGQGVAAAALQRVNADGTQSYETIAAFDSAQNKFVATPINLGAASEQVYLTLFGTGLRHCKTLTAVQASIGGVDVPVTYAGAQGQYAGLDQVNLLLPRSLIGRGEIEVKLMVEQHPTNTVKIFIK